MVGVFADRAVSPFSSAYCGAAAIGVTADVARGLGVPALRRAGLTGRRVHVAVVDTGIDGSRIPVGGGWAPTPGYVPGSSAPDHGTMVAYDVRIAAPDAQILDYALLKSGAGAWAAFLLDATPALAVFVERRRAAPGRALPRKAGPRRLQSLRGVGDLPRRRRHLGRRSGRRRRCGRAPSALHHRPAGAGATQGVAAAHRAGPGGRRLGLRLGLRGDRCGGGAQGRGVEAAGEEAPENGGGARRPGAGSPVASAEER